jgi:hypothetical protein
VCVCVCVLVVVFVVVNNQASDERRPAQKKILPPTCNYFLVEARNCLAVDHSLTDE